MKSCFAAIVIFFAFAVALPGGYSSSSTPSPTPGGETKCTPTTYYTTSTGFTEKSGTIYTTDTSALTLYGTNYKTSDVYATSTYVTTGYKTVETEVSYTKTITKPVVVTTYAYETITDYSVIKTASPCLTTITSVYHISSVIPHPYTSTKYDYYTKAITTYITSYYTTVIASPTSVCTSSKSGGY